MRGTDELFRAWQAARAAAAASEEKETHDSSSSSRSNRPRTGSRRPSHVLLNVAAVVGVHWNRTTAVSSLSRNGALIQVSFLLKPPPQPSTVFVAADDDLNPFVGPVILCSVDDLLLLRVNVGRREIQRHLKHHHDYYVYRASAEHPSLDLLESPPVPVFHREDVGLLPRPGGHYTVAALMNIGRTDVYELQLYHSDTSTWTTRQVPVEPPQWDPLPSRIPLYCGALLSHWTSAVLTIGGEGGTMAWVDLWRSILLCDVLCPEPSLRGVPVPLPSRQMSLNDGQGVPLNFAGHRRGISFNRDKGCLMLVHVEMHEAPPSMGLDDWEEEEKEVLDWEVTTWSNTKMSDSLADWHEERSVRASEITIDAQMLKRSGLPCTTPPPRDHSSDEADAATTAQAQQRLKFHNLSICQPTLCPNGADDVVYLVAREKYLHPNAWFLAVDMKEQGTLKHVASIGNQGHLLCHRIYCLSRISKYTNPKYTNRKVKTKSSATDPVSVDEEESNYGYHPLVCGFRKLYPLNYVICDGGVTRKKEEKSNYQAGAVE